MKERIITGVIGGVVYLGLLLAGGTPFTLFTAIIAAITYYEMVQMERKGRIHLPLFLGLVFSLSFVFNARWHFFAIDANILDLTILLMLLLFLCTIFIKTFNIQSAALILLSCFYVGYGFSLLVSLRLEALAMVLFVQLMIWATDTGAYFIGKSMGRKKLSPSVSPNKTVEGMVGGIVAAIVVAFIFTWIVHLLPVKQPDLLTHPLIVAGIAILISLVGQIGDLAESALKRHFQVKDSGKILPGHGGLLDRFDSLIFVLPVLHILHLIN